MTLSLYNPFLLLEDSAENWGEVFQNFPYRSRVGLSSSGKNILIQVE